MKQVSSGIPGLDEILNGGFTRPSTVLIAGTAGAGKTTFAMQSIFNAARNDEVCMYLMAILSKRLGSAMRIKSYFYIYYLSIVFMLIAEGYSSFTIYTEKVEMIGNLLFAIGMTLGLIATVKYWGWLVKELT